MSLESKFPDWGKKTERTADADRRIRKKVIERMKEVAMKRVFQIQFVFKCLYIIRQKRPECVCGDREVLLI